MYLQFAQTINLHSSAFICGSSFTEAPDRDDPAFKCGDFVGVCLSAKPEESDVVHDLLAHLAERMIEMNKEKKDEIRIVDVSGEKDAKETKIDG